MRYIVTLIKVILLYIGILIHRNKHSKVLYYHDVYFEDSVNTNMGTPMSLFIKQVATISKSGFDIVSKINKPTNQVSIMFDDGFRGIYDCREYFYTNNICPTVFLAVSLIGKPGYLTVDEIIELQNHGFNFQSHGWRHEDMTSLSDDQLQLELVEARKKLSELLGKSVDEICLPIGYFSDRLLEKISKESYREIYSSIPGDYEDLVYGMRRRNLVQSSSPYQVSMILKGGTALTVSRYLKLHKR